VSTSLYSIYLLIAGRCIIQDDEEELGNEIDSMGDIYRNAVFTVVAQWGTNADAGLFVPRDSVWHRPCQIDTTVDLAGESATQQFAVMSNASRCLSSSHLHSRGWVLQEDVLSIRRLVFRTHCIEWKCPAAEANDGNPIMSHSTYKGQDSTWSTELSTYFSSGVEKLQAWILNPVFMYLEWHESARRQGFRDRRRNHFDSWYEVIMDYSRRSLTYPSDTLPAIAGLANVMHQVYDINYAAGLWKEDLQIGLSWYISRPAKRELSQFLAPSWSWASNPGAVRFIRMRK